VTHRHVVLVTLASSLLACGGAPAVTVPVPASSAAAPQTVPARRSPVFLHFAGLLHASEVRGSLVGGAPVTPRAVALGGADFTLQPRNGGIGLAARVTQSDLGAGDLGSIEGGVLLGSPAFAVEGAYVMRNGYSVESGLSHDSVHTFGRGGVRMRGILGNSGAAVHFRAGYFVPIGQSFDADALQGWEGESTLSWTLPRFPLTIQAGYRLERFFVSGLEQEVSALVVGGGFTFGARR
jgi:hypothetical protein